MASMEAPGRHPVWNMAGPTSSLEHGAWRKANSDSTGRARRRYDRMRMIELGVIMRDFWSKKGAFRRADLCIVQIQLRHTIMHNLPENYHNHVPVAAEATSLDYYGDWPGQMERQIEESLVRAAQDEGPPDWVAGPEGNIVTVDDEVAIKIK